MERSWFHYGRRHIRKEGILKKRLENWRVCIACEAKSRSQCPRRHWQLCREVMLRPARSPTATAALCRPGVPGAPPRLGLLLDSKSSHHGSVT